MFQSAALPVADLGRPDPKVNTLGTAGAGRAFRRIRRNSPAVSRAPVSGTMKAFRRAP